MTTTPLDLPTRPSLLPLGLALLVAACSPGRPIVAPEPSPDAGERIAPPSASRVPARGVLVAGLPADVGMDPSLPPRLDSIVRAALREGAAPGAALAVGRHGRLVYLQGHGALEYPDGNGAAPAPAAPTSLYDLASLTKVVATTTMAMILEESGRLDLDRPVASYVPELTDPAKAAVTVRMLLTHSGGFEAYAPLHRTARGHAEYLTAINARPLAYPPGTRMVYSDWDMILLQVVLERVAGLPLHELTASRIFRPLGMHDTRFAPDTTDAALRRRIAPTTLDSLRVPLRGVVHDGNARALGGVAGHAGLFSTARDLAIFAQMLVDGGTYDQVRILAPQAIARWTARQGSMGSRALGWDTPAPQSSAGRYFSPRSFGHTGFTGTSMWIDPERGLFVVLLMNRVTPRGDGTRHVQLRRDVADAVQAAVLDAPRMDWEAMR